MRRISICTACVAFVYRSRKRRTPYTCKKDARLCSKTSVRDYTAYAACTKCRLDRCLQLGVVAPELHRLISCSTARRQETPILFSVVQAIQNGFSIIKAKHLTRKVYGTSESGDQCLTYPKLLELFEENTAFCRLITEDIPIVSKLDSGAKERVFKNVLFIYNTIFCVIHNMSINSNRTRFYRTPNMYLDLDLSKVAFFLQTVNSGDWPTKTHESTILSRFLIKLCTLA
ncbi:hypothetical protein L596_020620 [Steinernema carpocapsae]|uniref:Nuclear receptor domain-containing protein n=1 Tax=Steinernema carpocapsae TaxID=34508 RepID=A0A4U5MUA0_STECR|nr:hypothetical protein L596_020620 [Steinernema carpocapsae]